MASIARYERGETAVFTATLRDKDGAAIAAASLTSLSLTLTDAHSGGVVNSRNAQNVLNANNVTVNSSGGLVWTIQIADVAQQGTASVERAEHVAKFVAVTSTETIEHIHRLYITATRGLTTYEDVELQLGEIAENDRLFVEQIIDGITARAEEYTGLRFQHATETQVFSPTTFRDSVRVRRYPIESVTSLKEDVDGVFGEDLTIAATSGNHASPDNPASNLLDPDTSRKWSTTWNDTTSDTARIVIDAVDEISPKSLKLKKCNAKSGRVRLYGADDAALTTNVIYYDFDLYDAAEQSFAPSPASTRDSRLGVRWASSYMVDGWSQLTDTLNSGTSTINPDGSTRKFNYHPSLVAGVNTSAHHARFCGTSYYQGEPPKKPSDFPTGSEPGTSAYGVEFSGNGPFFWGNATDDGAEEQAYAYQLRIQKGTHLDRSDSPTAKVGWTQEGTSNVWYQNFGYTDYHFGNSQIWYGDTLLQYQSDGIADATYRPGTNQFSQHQTGPNSTYTIYLNLGGANPNGAIQSYPNYAEPKPLPIYYLVSQMSAVNALKTDSGGSYFHLDSRGDNADRFVARGCGAAVGSPQHAVITIGVRLDPASSGDYWTLAWRHATNPTGFYYLRDRQVLRYQGVDDASTPAGSFVDIPLLLTDIADNQWHAISVAVDSGKKVTLHVDGVDKGSATFASDANLSAINVYRLGGERVPATYIKGDGVTPYAPTDEAGFTYANHGPSKIDIAYFSIGDSVFACGSDAASIAEFAKLAQAEAMHHLGLSTDNLKRRYWAIDFDGVTKLGAKSKLEIGAVELGSRHESQYDPTDYYVDADAGTVNLRAGTFLGGHGSVQVVYAGGYRDIGAVPMSLRLAATQQAAYIYQRRSSMGLKSESISGMSQTRWSEDLLPAFKDALDRLVPPVVF
jgi:hypothetical protein